MYVGHNDLSINGPVKLQEVQEKNTDEGIKVSNELSLDKNQIKDVGLATDDADAVTYGQVKEELEELRDKIVGEISLGTWKFDIISSTCLLYTSPSPRDRTRSRMPSSA